MKAAGEYGGYSYVYEIVIAKNGNITFKINDDTYTHHTPQSEKRRKNTQEILFL